MDVLAVKRASEFAREYAISGKGPLVMEFVTYRYGLQCIESFVTVGGHSMSDPGTTYRTREEIQNMRSSNDAIQGLKNKMLEWGVVSENELKVRSQFQKWITHRKSIKSLGKRSTMKSPKPRSLLNVRLAKMKLTFSRGNA